MSSNASFGCLGLGMITLGDMIGKWGAGLAMVTKGLMAGLLVGHLVGIKVVHLVSSQLLVNCCSFKVYYIIWSYGTPNISTVIGFTN